MTFSADEGPPPPVGYGAAESDKAIKFHSLCHVITADYFLCNTEQPYFA